MLHGKGQVEVISSLERDGRAIAYDIRFGVFVVFEGETEYIRNCFEEYMVRTDPSGRYACLYKRWHLIGLEVGISVASVGLRGEATGAAIGFNADVVATAKRDLKAGEMLDGEGGYTVWGKLLPAATSLAHRRAAARASRTACACCVPSGRATCCAGPMWQSTKRSPPTARAARWSSCSAARLRVNASPRRGNNCRCRWQPASEHPCRPTPFWGSAAVHFPPSCGRRSSRDVASVVIW